MTPRAIEVHVQELVLEGFSPADRLRVGDALRTELARLLREGGLPPGLVGSGQRDAIDAGPYSRPPVATPSSLGCAVAAAVYSGLGRTGGSRG